MVLVKTRGHGATRIAVFGVETDGRPEVSAGALMRLRNQIDEAVSTNGAVLLRGLRVSDPDEFQRIVDLCGVPLNGYRPGDTPRFGDPGDVPLHSEMSYARARPNRLYFCCDGAGPFTDRRAILADLDPEVRAHFEARGVMYRRNLHGGLGFGRSWQQTFETGDRAVVEGYLRSAQAEFAWTSDGGLRVSQIRPAIRVHPFTGDRVWFNQIDQWHPVNLSAYARHSAAGEPWPYSVTYGDGGSIPLDHLDHVRQVARRNEIVLPWQPGDVIVIDTMLVLSGRPSYAPSRGLVMSLA